jgi:hypothetical protein
MTKPVKDEAGFFGTSVPMPRKGFEWMAVSWGGPNQPAARECSYCEAPIDPDDVPLIVWTNTGWCARFCVQCQAHWWGLL